MKISRDWLSDFLDPVPPTADAVERLTMAGYPVEDVERVGGVDVLDVEVTSNRPDLLSHAGVARELSAVCGGAFNRGEPKPADSGTSIDGLAGVAVERPDLCPHFTARLIRGVKVGPSPDWMRRRLEHVGLRPINNVVDVTNYVLFELGQPLHAFDHAKLAGGRLVVRDARDGEKLTTLDGQERVLTPDMLVVADGERAASLAGVMGGAFSEVGDDTTDILLEAARFDPLTVRNTSRRLKLMSDSSYRFERGLDPTGVDRASRRAAELILQVAGGELCAGVAEAGAARWEPRTIVMRPMRLAKILGVELPANEVNDALTRLGLSPREVDGGVEVTVPPHRLDLTQEIDVIEEAARVVGYDRVPEREAITITVRPPDPALAAADVIRDALCAAGYFEAVTFSFVSDPLAKHFVPQNGRLRRVDPGVRKADGNLRPGVLPGLIEAVRYNETVGNGHCKFFEIGSAFWRDDRDGPQERRRLAMAGGTDYADCRGAIELVLERLDATRPTRVEPAEAAGFGAGACGRVIWGGEPVGFVGLVDEAVVDALDLRHRPCVAELDAEALVAAHRPVPSNAPLPRFPRRPPRRLARRRRRPAVRRPGRLGRGVETRRRGGRRPRRHLPRQAAGEGHEVRHAHPRLPPRRRHGAPRRRRRPDRPPRRRGEGTPRGGGAGVGRTKEARPQRGTTVRECHG